MNANLLRTCAGLWSLGLLGMCVARMGLDLDPETLPFRCAGALWILGGLGYTGLGFLGLVVHAERAARRSGGSANIKDR
jgi:hypothetical protein